MIYTINKNSNFALRTSTTASVRFTWARMVTSTAIGVSAIPTEYNENRYTNSSIPIYFSILL